MNIELVENGPIVVTKSNDDKVALCRCGRTKTAPYCDTSHLTARRGFPALVIEDEQPFRRSDMRDWDIQDSEDEREKEYNRKRASLKLYNNKDGDEFLSCECGNGSACNCASCACDDSGCENYGTKCS